MPRWTDEVARAEIMHDGHTYDSAADFVEQSSSTYEYAWSAVLVLVFNGWFGRVWVVQEILLARQIVIHLGPHKVPQEMLLNASKWVNYWMHLSQGAPIPELDFFSPALRTRDTMVHGARLHFGDVLTLYRDRPSTDPRDKVFALLSICDPKSLQICPRHDGNAPLSSTQSALKSELVADYSKSTTEVYMECAQCLLYQEPGLYVLSLVGCDGYFPGRESMAPGIPSWVPDPSITLLPKPLRSFGGDAFTTATAMRSMFRVSEDARTLHLSAAKCDKVVCMGESHAELVGAMLLALLQGAFLTMASSFGAVYPPTKEPSVSALARTLIADLSDGTHPASPALTISFLNWLGVLVGTAMEIKRSRWNRIFTQALVLRPSRHAYRAEKLAAVVETFISTCETPEFAIRQAMETSMGGRDYTGRIFNFPRAGVASARRKDAKESQVQDDPDLFATTFNSVGLNRRFFMTEKGCMGLGPFTLLEGDTIMLVAGAYVPYVFRPAAAEGGSWVLVGETYIHGIMHGEALQAGELEFKTIDLV
ncbi:hypothetical protein B0O99DRAFT_693587 [Bisporella sp. PMI_857]|nr:hypothetical protein B0O99DRAFT_693587 [Bisporella sp. PMI_857]